MLKIKEAIVVEGRYDKNTLSQIVDTVIIETTGFGVFSDKEKIDLLRRLAEKKGLIVLTDSDGAGFLIRSYIKGALPKDKVKHAYVPDIEGKEKRKRSASKEGKLGVEGMSPEVLIEALRRAGATFENVPGTGKNERVITKADMLELGLSGKPGSVRRRLELTKNLGLPEKLSPNALLDVLNAMYTYEEFHKLIS